MPRRETREGCKLCVGSLVGKGKERGNVDYRSILLETHGYSIHLNPHQFSSVQSLSHVQLFTTPWTAARQASLSITNSQSPPKPMSIESVMPSNHLILCHPLLLLPSIFPRIRVFSNESALRIRWPKYWSFSFNISPYNEHPGLISFRMNWLDLLAVQETLLHQYTLLVILQCKSVERILSKYWRQWKSG